MPYTPDLVAKEADLEPRPGQRIQALSRLNWLPYAIIAVLLLRSLLPGRSEAGL